MEFGWTARHGVAGSPSTYVEWRKEFPGKDIVFYLWRAEHITWIRTHLIDEQIYLNYI